MKFFLEEDEIEIIKPIDDSEDKAIVILPTVGKRGDKIPDEVKEQTAIDALTLGPSKAAEINGVPISSASKYADGKDIANDDTRSRVLAAKYGIQDVAVIKLMSALNLLEPGDAVTIKDQMAIISGLGNLVEKVSDKGNNTNQVHLHLHAPSQRKDDDYEVIEA